MNITGIISTLLVHDLDILMAFFQKFGFNLAWKCPEEASSHASMSSSVFSFMSEKVGIGKKPEKANLNFRKESVEILHKTFSDSNIKIGDLQKTVHCILGFSIQGPNLIFRLPSSEYEG